ncbi:unnamed protein product, partial [Didymodactylos carnosus]
AHGMPSVTGAGVRPYPASAEPMPIRALVPGSADIFMPKKVLHW